MIYAYGLFWRADEVDWHPGNGRPFRLLGYHRGAKRNLRIVDFKVQSGIYILYGNHGAYYVGLTKNLGTRLHNHIDDEHKGYWDKFSWFGFRNVLGSKDKNGLNNLKKMAKIIPSKPTMVIKDIEAMMIKSFGVQNYNDAKISTAAEWTKIKLTEREKYLKKSP